MTNPLVEPERARQIGRGDEGQTRRARDAAEALFKPKVQASTEEPHPIASGTTTGEQPVAPRRPRIIAVPPAPPRTEVAAVAAQPTPAAQRAPRLPRSLRTRKITAADHGRIRILATHGLTLEQVAELYDVSPGTIERIVGGQ